MPLATTAEIRAWAQANGYEVKSRGRLSAELVTAYRASTDPKRRTRNRAAASPAPAVSGSSDPSGHGQSAVVGQALQPADADTDLLGRVVSLEQQVTDLTARLDAAEVAAAASPRRYRFGRRP